MSDGGLVARVLGAVGDVPAQAWDALAGEGNPFVSHAFLTALEDSGSVGPGSGWQPAPIVIEDGAGHLLGVLPSYVKGHSQGEYVFDHAWADAWQRAGGRYYPKFQIAAPFTPATGPRLLLADDAFAPPLLSAAEQVCTGNGFSSAHATFVDPAQLPLFEAAGWLPRSDIQFHWFNRDYRTFDDFLAQLSARKRKTIRKEREGARAGLDDKVLLMLALEEGVPIAGALNFVGADTLYGRYWGCTREVRFLHFELCYYQAIEAAIERGLARVEAGAQGPHKLARGYQPVETWSAHWIADPGFRDAVADFLQRERAGIAVDREWLAGRTPFKRG